MSCRDMNLEDVRKDFIEKTWPDLWTMIEDGRDQPHACGRLERWLMDITNGEGALEPARLLDVLIALETIMRGRTAVAHLAAMDNRLACVDVDDSIETYMTAFSVSTALRGVLHVRLLAAVALPEEGAGLVVQAAHFEEDEADRLRAAIDAAMSRAVLQPPSDVDDPTS